MDRSAPRHYKAPNRTRTRSTGKTGKVLLFAHHPYDGNAALQVWTTFVWFRAQDAALKHLGPWDAHVSLDPSPPLIPITVGVPKIRMVASFKLTMPLSILTILSLIISVCRGQSLTNFTLDDEQLDLTGQSSVSYSPKAPATVWKQGSTCSNCTFHPDSSSTMDGSWHDATWIPQSFPSPPTMTILFPGEFESETCSSTVLIDLIISGSAIYVFCVVVEEAEFGIQTITNLSFILDGELQSDFYYHEPNDARNFLYNQSVYNNTTLGSSASLPNGKHNLTVIVYGNILFDYAVYT